MAMNDALEQYMKCYGCKKFGSCPDCEEKIKAAWDRPMVPMGSFKTGISGTPYKSKYFDDHRYDPPKPIMTCDWEKQLMKILEAM